jgi:3alpha(or 20beta)-hydroxysteroid dehydrogenase
VSRFGRLDVLVNNAGIVRRTALVETSVADFDLHVRVNQLGPLIGIKVCLPALRKGGGGSVVNICSISGMFGTADAVAYCCSKWALRGLSKALAVELAPDRIRVNTILPGRIDTRMVAYVPNATSQRQRERIPLKRFAAPEEVSPLVIFLASDDSAYLTGTEVLFDGGFSADHWTGLRLLRA